MKITEEKINQSIDAISKSDNPMTLYISKGNTESYQIIESYLSSEAFHFLSIEEKAYMSYLNMVLWRAAISSGIELKEIGIDQILDREESNWALFHKHRNRDFRESVTPFFQDYQEEDALAFIEDSLIDGEEEEFVSTTGREFLFIGLKTILDLITGNHQE